MSDIDETAGVGAADPITGVTGGGDDLASTAQLPDTDGQDDGRADGDAATADYSTGDRESVEAEAQETVTNDAVAGETVDPGAGDGNDGPTGGAPGEITPIEPDNDLDADSIDLDDER